MARTGEPWAPSDPQILELLANANIVASRRLPIGSNDVFLVELEDGESKGLAIYKPRRGEAPLWDFASGSLYRREIASYLLSRFLSWPDIPPTVVRDGPLGVGALQCFVSTIAGQHYFSFRDERSSELRAIAVFDLLTNNADRKAGHCLLGVDGQVWAIDHGLTFHEEPKLRTVIWDFVGEPLPDGAKASLTRLRDALATDAAELAELRSWLEPGEVEALVKRCESLLERGVFPEPPAGRRSVPWPMV
jgi:uncharacterized repeat protein (TIGR03843 family)